MDTVVSGKEGRARLLVLSERASGKEIIIKMPECRTDYKLANITKKEEQRKKKGLVARGEAWYNIRKAFILEKS